MQNFCFRVVIFFVLRKVGFRLVQACDFPIVWKILILLVFWCRITNYFLVDLVLLSFKNSLTCVWLHRFSLLISFDFCSYPFICKREYPSTINGHLQTVLAGYFWRFFIPLHYYWKVLSCLLGCFWKNLENFHIWRASAFLLFLLEN